MEDREELQAYLKYIYNSDFEEIMNTLEDIQTLLLYNGVDFPLDIEHFKNKANDLICKADESLKEIKHGKYEHIWKIIKHSKRIKMQ